MKQLKIERDSAGKQDRTTVLIANRKGDSLLRFSHRVRQQARSMNAVSHGGCDDVVATTS